MRRRMVLAGLMVLAGVGWAGADVRMPNVFGNDMVLQQALPIQVWGWADAGEKVVVSFAGQTVETTTDEAGHWRATLAPLPAGGPHEMIVQGRNAVRLQNVLVGEVWICSGQSNMEWNLANTEQGDAAAKQADYAQLRVFGPVPHLLAGSPRDNLPGQWHVCTPAQDADQVLRGFSAVGYFFGRKLHEELQVPVGVIQTAWGGTRIEPWTNPEGFRRVPALSGIVEQIEQAPVQYRSIVADRLEAIETWTRAARAALAADAPLPPAPDWPEHPLAVDQTRPTGIFNAMVAPLVGFGMRGVIWYQGESNVGEGMLYAAKMRALIEGWRAAWGQGVFPFFYVQLAPFNYYWINDRTALPQVWEAQLKCLELPATGIALTMDIGNLEDIHPRNKLDVGKRLARWALAQTYGRDLVYSGPLYESMAVEGDKIRIHFTHTGSGLAARDGKPLTWFEIAGEQGDFVEAQAVIEGDTVVVASPQVAAPTAVRFAWHDQATPNLMNKEGLPAAPFHTDSD